MILARAEVDFRAPLSEGDHLEIGVRPVRVGTKSFELAYEVRVGEQVAAEAKTVIVSYDYSAGRPVEVPDHWREGIGGLMGVFDLQTLPNGLRLLTAPMDHSQSVSCFIMLAAGSRYETPETSGIAHFAEHMFFKGTEKRPTARDIGYEIDGIGGEFNAFTGKEYTGYYVRCAGRAPRGRARRPRRHAAPLQVRSRRGRPGEGRDRRGDEHVLRHASRLHRRCVRLAPLRRPAARLGHHRPQGNGARGDADTFLDYTSRWYKPARMVVGVAGKIDAGLEADIQRLLGDLPADETGEPTPVQISDNGGHRVKIHTKASDQAHLVIGVRSYPLAHPDRYALQVLTTVLGTGMSSRLFTEVRERRGLAYYVYAMNHGYTDAGSLYSQAGVDIERIDEAITTIVAELKRIADEPVPQKELDKARNVAKGRFVLQVESPHGLIMFGLRREVLEHERPSRRRSSLSSTRSRSTTCSAWRRT